MQSSGRMIAGLLLVVIAASLPGMHALAFSAVQPSHPAGCHSHGPATPHPASFQCCASGHQAAMPNATFSPRAMDVQLCRLAAGEEGRFRFASDRHSVMFVVPSNSPPDIAPLRI
jgi:hypothetical protein